MESPPPNPVLVRELIDWYRAMGADAVVAEQPVDWLAEAGRVPGAAFQRSLAPASAQAPAAPAAAPHAAPAAHQDAARRPTAPVAARPAPPASPPARAYSVAAPDAAESAARAAARSAGTLEALRAALEAFDGCGLKVTAKSLCFYRGAADAKLMIVGEAPGREEDLDGRPFVGRAGQLLDRMLAAIGLGEADVHITNVVYWRPPGNRTPTPQETAVCKPFLLRQIELVQPAFILTLGGPAAKAVLDIQDGIMKVRGTWREMTAAERAIPVLPTLHPAYLLRSPAAKRQVWKDLLALKAALAGGPAGRRRGKAAPDR